MASSINSAEQRTCFEQAVFRVRTYMREQKNGVRQCFISYAWGIKAHERWVEKSLATDLQKAGIQVLLDRWENAGTGGATRRFVDRIARCSHVVVVGTPLYLKKYENRSSERGYAVAAEFDVIGKRMLGSEAERQRVFPILLEGTAETSLPALLHDRVSADFRHEEDYLRAVFDVILSICGIAPRDPAADLREWLAGLRAR